MARGQLIAQCDNGPFLEATTRPSMCGNFNGSIIVNVTGGIGPVNIYLDGTDLGDTVSVIDAIPFGYYNLEAIDSIGCVDAVTVYVNNLPGVLITDISVGYRNCDSINGAFVDVAVDAPGDVVFSADGVNFQSEPQLVNLPSDSITIFARDEFGCTDRRDVFIPNPFPEIIRIETIEPDCNDNDSEIRAVYYASWGPYYVSIDDLSYVDGPVVRGLGPGSYTLYVRNELGCVIAFAVDLEGPPRINAGEIDIQPATCGSSNGTVQIQRPDGVITYFLGGDERPDGIFQGLPAGQYTLRYVDTVECERDTVLFVPETDCEIYFSNVFSPNGDGVNDTFAPVFQSNLPEFTSIEIADRWGSIVFSCEGSCAWDGKMGDIVAENGVYARWVIS
jgi:gliding motility-associated-like protein